jgi:putative metallohydrolase (TIGR04338 family)
MKMRDMQRKLVYTAERKHSLHAAIRIEDIKDIRRFVLHVMRRKAMKPWRHAFVGSVFKVTDGRRRRSAVAFGCFQTSPTVTLRMPRWSRSMLVILHELSHALTPNRYSWHGIEFCTNFLYVVKHVMGKAAHAELEQLFREHGVEFDYSYYNL